MKTLFSTLRKTVYRRPLALFCTVPKNNLARESLEDWEYCKLISQELKSKNVNTAISLLFRSYFDHKILDIQIYNSIFNAINKEELPLSYAEILYQVYREHFPPQSLLLNWMYRLTASENQLFINLLKKDYEAINQPYPVKKSSRREGRQERTPPQIKESVEQGVRSRRARHIRKSEQNQIYLDNLDKISIPLPSQNLLPEDFIKEKLSVDIKSSLEHLSSVLKNYSKINLYDVEIEIDNSNNQNDEIGEQLDQNEEYYEQEDGDDTELPSGLGLFGLDITKIKIGRVEFIADSNEQNHDNNDPSSDKNDS